MSRLCALYGVTRAGYYAWEARRESAHSERDRVVVRAIRKIFEASEGTYGSPRVQHELVAQGIRVSRRRVERLMRAGGMRGRVARVYRSNPRLHQVYAQHPNRLWKSRAKRPDAIWVGDVIQAPAAAPAYLPHGPRNRVRSPGLPRSAQDSGRTSEHDAGWQPGGQCSRRVVLPFPHSGRGTRCRIHDRQKPPNVPSPVRALLQPPAATLVAGLPVTE